jgi:hypothetical protein
MDGIRVKSIKSDQIRFGYESEIIIYDCHREGYRMLPILSTHYPMLEIGLSLQIDLKNSSISGMTTALQILSLRDR